MAERSSPRGLPLLVLLVAASAMCVVMVIARVLFTGTTHYGFLVWNLLLAWTPLVFAVVASTAAASRRRVAFVVLALSAAVWLLFFPNGPYILTDFQHIGEMGHGVPTWYDVMLVAWFAWTGLLLGIVSLFLMQRLVEGRLGARIGWWFVVGVTALASVGIYVGRFLRWNSWSIFSDPGVMTDPVWERLRNPAGSARLIAFTLLYGLFFLFAYGSMRAFAGLAVASRDRIGTGDHAEGQDCEHVAQGPNHRPPPSPTVTNLP
jgi:uncharacterized membrane protein